MDFLIEIDAAAIPPAGNAHLASLFASVTKPRYAKQGCSWVTLQRIDGPSGDSYLAPAIEVPATGKQAARLAAQRLGFACREVRLCR